MFSNGFTDSHQNQIADEYPRGYAVLCIVSLALALFAWKALIALGDPGFTGDAAHRMLSANRLLSRLGNRIWLPYLQVQIYALARLKLQYAVFNLGYCDALFTTLANAPVDPGGLVRVREYSIDSKQFVYTRPKPR